MTRLWAKKQTGIFQDMMAFVLENKKWWLFPVFFVLGFIGLLILLGSTGIAPLIYTLY